MSEQDNATDFIQSSNKAREYENKKSKNKINVWSLYYRTEIVWFSIGFILGVIIL